MSVYENSKNKTESPQTCAGLGVGVKPKYNSLSIGQKVIHYKEEFREASESLLF